MFSQTQCLLYSVYMIHILIVIKQVEMKEVASRHYYFSPILKSVKVKMLYYRWKNYTLKD